MDNTRPDGAAPTRENTIPDAARKAAMDVAWPVIRDYPEDASWVWSEVATRLVEPLLQAVAPHIVAAELDRVRAEVGTPDDSLLSWITRATAWMREANVQRERAETAQAEAERASQYAGRVELECKRLRDELDTARALLRDLADPNPCDHHDHHGHCQTHGWLDEGPCPHARGRAFLAALDGTAGGAE